MSQNHLTDISKEKKKKRERMGEGNSVKMHHS